MEITFAINCNAMQNAMLNDEDVRRTEIVTLNYIYDGTVIDISVVSIV